MQNYNTRHFTANEGQKWHHKRFYQVHLTMDGCQTKRLIEVMYKGTNYIGRCQM